MRRTRAESGPEMDERRGEERPGCRSRLSPNDSFRATVMVTRPDEETAAMQTVQKITPCLWFDGQAEEAAKFYVGIFPNSKITHLSRYGEAGREVHGQRAGTVL